jgi:hypothetical protein
MRSWAAAVALLVLAPGIARAEEDPFGPGFGPEDEFPPTEFKVFFGVMIALVVVSIVVRLLVTKRLADRSPDPAATWGTALLDEDGVSAAYLADAVRDRDRSAPASPTSVRPVEERLGEVDALHARGVIDDAEHAAQRARILGTL